MKEGGKGGKCFIYHIIRQAGRASVFPPHGKWCFHVRTGRSNWSFAERELSVFPAHFGRLAASKRVSRGIRTIRKAQSLRGSEQVGGRETLISPSRDSHESDAEICNFSFLQHHHFVRLPRRLILPFKARSLPVLISAPADSFSDTEPGSLAKRWELISSCCKTTKVETLPESSLPKRNDVHPKRSSRTS